MFRPAAGSVGPAAHLVVVAASGPLMVAAFVFRDRAGVG